MFVTSLTDEQVNVCRWTGLLYKVQLLLLKSWTSCPDGGHMRSLYGRHHYYQANRTTYHPGDA